MNSIPQDDTPQKQCNRCQQSFPATLEFFHKSKGGLHACCKKCRNRSLKPYNDAHVEDRKIRYQEHREEVSAKQKEYREANKVEISKQKRQSYQEHRKEIRAQHTQYRKANREQINARKRQHYACYYCFRKFEKRKDRTYIYHLDHTVPISRTDFTPRNDASYVVLACPHCNQHKSDKLPHEWPEGGRLF